MEDLTRNNFGEEDDTSTESSAKKKKSSSSVRKIGAFAKMTAETPPEKTTETTPSKELFKSKEKTAEDTSSSESQEKSSTDQAEQADETPEVLAQKNQLLQEELADRIESYQEVMSSTPPDSAEHIQAAAAKNLDESVKAKAVDPSVEADPVIEAEYARQLAEIELPESAEVEVQEIPEITDTDEEVTPDEPAQTTPAPASSVPFTPTQPAQQSSQQAATPRPLQQPVAPPPPPTPPTPRPPYGSPAPAPQQPGNTAPILNRNTLPQPTSKEKTERSKRAQSFMAGGILGYMIGRRGGRKRTERRYEPELKKLNSELEATKKHLTSREEALKTATFNKPAAARELPQQPEKIQQPQKLTATETLQRVVKPSNEAPVREKTVASPEISQKSEKNAEPKRVIAPQKPATPQEVRARTEQLPTPELLKIAESLFIDGMSVKQLYDTNRIDRKGLVTLVQEGVSGGNLAVQFEKVELGKERQAERAREFRHDDPSFSTLPQASITPVLPEPILSKPSRLPNSPDKNALQPLHVQSEFPGNAVEITNQSSQKPADLLGTKKAELTIAATAAVAIALLIIWAILS
jgi:hypothetical protein